MMKKKETICAVVVTYNRKNQLLECLEALKTQTYQLDHIVVVDNNSQDGTVKYLYQHGFKTSNLFTLLSLPYNQGGAGGFYTGIEFAVNCGFDYVWLMDDDGFPDTDCLERLSPYIKENCYIGPLVIDSNKTSKLSFSIRLPNCLDVIDNAKDIPKKYIESNIINDFVLPFNGTLISSKLVKEMGLPKKDYFIWGDEKEYTWRAERYNATILTVVDAIFFHPVTSSTSTKMFFGKLRFNNADSLLKLYCFCRNSVANYKEYRGIHYALLFSLMTLWFFVFTKPNFKRLKVAISALWHGFVNDFSHHRKYLNDGKN